MKLTRLLHNPSAGDEEHEKEELVKIIEAEGYECRYSSTKKDNWNELEHDLDFVTVAGGDGTVRKVVEVLLNRRKHDKHFPLAVVPLGTANNIGTALKLEMDAAERVKQIKKAKTKVIDIGRLHGIEETDFFIESFGFGMFPRLMKVMKERDEEAKTPEEELIAGLKELHQIVLKRKAKYCKIEADGVVHSGKYLMVEIMNIPYVGPNLALAPSADPGDGYFELVMIPESSRDELAAYVQGRINGQELHLPLECIRVKSLKLEWDGNLAHADDQLLKLEKGNTVNIEMVAGTIDFLV